MTRTDLADSVRKTAIGGLLGLPLGIAACSLALDLDESTFRLGQAAFHLGYPQGRPGEAATRLLGSRPATCKGRKT